MIKINITNSKQLSRWHSGKEIACQCRRHEKCGFDPWVRKIPCRRKWQPTPVLLPGKYHGQRSLAGYIPWGCAESDTTEHAGTHTTNVYMKRWPWKEQSYSRLGDKFAVSEHLLLWLWESLVVIWITTNYRKFLKRWEYRTTWPNSWETCTQVKKQQSESDMVTMVQTWERGMSRLCTVTPLIFCFQYLFI